MEETRYGLTVDLAVPYDVAIERATNALREEGFGILTSIDVHRHSSRSSIEISGAL